MNQSADSLMAVFGYKRVKPRRCKYCRAEFRPQRPGAKVCSPECAQAIAEKVRGKIERQAEREVKKQTRAQIEAIKTLPMLKREAQVAFNKFIRLRDTLAGHPCICCGVPFGDQKYGGAVDCGHYRSVGSAPHLRFNEDNAHAQLKQCNRHGGGRAVDYRIGLIARIGLERVEALETNNVVRKYTASELRAIKALYAAKAKQLTEGK